MYGKYAGGNGIHKYNVNILILPSKIFSNIIFLTTQAFETIPILLIYSIYARQFSITRPFPLKYSCLMDFLNDVMQSVCWVEFLFLYTMPHFLSELLWKLCPATHWEWVWSLCAGECSQHRSPAQLPWWRCVVILRSLCTAYLVPLALHCARLGDLQYWLHLQMWSKHMQIPMLLFFSRMKQPHSFPTPTICSNPCATAMFKTGSHELLVVRMANTGTSKVDGDTKHLTFLGQQTSYHASHVFLLMLKRLWTLTSQEM